MRPMSTPLSDAERNLVYHIEVLGLSTKRAAEICGVGNPYEVLKRPDVASAAEALREAGRQRVNISKDDVLSGIQYAIQDAKMTADPMAQIAGWREISKMLGYDAPKQVNITVTGPVADMRRAIETLPDNELAQLIHDDVIDVEFYVDRQPD